MKLFFTTFPAISSRVVARKQSIYQCSITNAVILLVTPLYSTPLHSTPLHQKLSKRVLTNKRKLYFTEILRLVRTISSRHKKRRTEERKWESEKEKDRHPSECFLLLWTENSRPGCNFHQHCRQCWLTYSCTCLHCVVENVTSNAFIGGLVRGLKFTNHKLAGKFIGGDLVYDGHVEVILVPRDCG